MFFIPPDLMKGLQQVLKNFKSQAVFFSAKPFLSYVTSDALKLRTKLVSALLLCLVWFLMHQTLVSSFWSQTAPLFNSCGLEFKSKAMKCILHFPGKITIKMGWNSLWRSICLYMFKEEKNVSWKHYCQYKNYAPTEIILSQILKSHKVHTPEQLPMSRQSVVKDKCSLVVPFFSGRF